MPMSENSGAPVADIPERMSRGHETDPYTIYGAF